MDVRSLSTHSSGRQAMTLPVQLIAPENVALPPAPLPLMMAQKFSSVHTIDNEAALSAQRPHAPQASPRPCKLDGFKLLDACKVEFPDEAHRADICGLNAVAVVDEDLSYFTNLRRLDAGRNQLPLRALLAALPALRQLALPCNALCSVDSLHGCFQTLVSLDLSYNALPAEAVAELTALPNLAELDLTCNGLAKLPPASVFQNFQALERLVLERNGIQDEWAFVCLAAAPRLRDLQIGHNALRRVPPEVTERDRFPELSVLSLAFNHFEYEQDIIAVADLVKLELLVLYGNALLGPTGEDPAGDSIETLAQEALQARDGWTERGLDILTEIPRQRAQAPPPGAPASAIAARRSAYRGVTMTAVEADNVPPAADFRKAGHQANLEGRQFQPIMKPTASGQLVQDILGDEKDGPDAPPPEDGGDPTRTFLTGVDAAAPLPMPQWSEGRTRAVDDGHPESAGAATASLFGRDLRPRPADSGKLRAAMTALRYALDHPMTSHTHIPANDVRRPGATNLANRETAAARARQLPRRPFVPFKSASKLAEEEAQTAREKRSKAHGMMAAIERELDQIQMDSAAAMAGEEDGQPPHDNLGQLAIVNSH